MHVSTLTSASSSDAAPDVHSRTQFHRRLARFNRKRLCPTYDATSWRTDLDEELQMRAVENQFVERERAATRAPLAELPTEPEAFMHWYDQLPHGAAWQDDALLDWLAERANAGQLRWFLGQDAMADTGLDQLLAFGRLRFESRPALAAGLDAAAAGSAIEEPETSIDATVWEALAQANLNAALASNRRYAYQALGALGVVAGSVTGRRQSVQQGLRRLGLGGEAIETSAPAAAAESTRELIRALVMSDAKAARPIAEGALMRLNAAARCAERYRQELRTAPVETRAA